MGSEGRFFEIFSSCLVESHSHRVYPIGKRFGLYVVHATDNRKTLLFVRQMHCQNVVPRKTRTMFQVYSRQRNCFPFLQLAEFHSEERVFLHPKVVLRPISEYETFSGLLRMVLMFWSVAESTRTLALPRVQRGACMRTKPRAKEVSPISD